MGSRKNWPRELADRCNAVGWNARLVPNGHWKADLPDGTTMSWAESPSDTNGYKMAMRKARHKGLDALEQKLKLQREKDRLERIAQDRQLNGVPEHLMQSAKQAPEPKKEAKMEPSNPSLGYVEVEGIRLGIAEVAQARYQPSRGGEPRVVEDARELLLVDGSVRFQCLKPTGGFRDGKAEICNRTFDNPRGLPTHQSRMHPERDLGGVLPVEPRPGPTKEEILADRVPVAIRTEPAPKAEPVPTAPPTGVMARMEDLGNQVLDLHFEAQRLANHAQTVGAALVQLAQDLPRELVDDETRQKAELLDQMRGLLK
jgi:hypothetical protein